MENGLNYLNSLGLHKVKPGLERIKTLLGALGNPQNKVPGILIAGTNGKGSVAAAISSILSAQGYKVGLYTSPHLINITERIKTNNVQISESVLSLILLEIKEVAEKAQIEPSYFEIITAAAFLYFAREKADFNILEVGLGGRWDATNVITPLLSIITNITLEHTEYLGNTIAEIAAEKACIIKPSVPIITAAEDEAFDVIEQESSESDSPLYLYDRDFLINADTAYSFHYRGISSDIKNFKSNLRGSYQTKNLGLAIAAIEILEKNNHISITQESIRNGLSAINWEGRFEIIRDKPPLILDSAHNPGAAKSLRESILEAYPDTKFTFLIGMLDDKGHLEFLKEIASIAEKLIITKVPSERTADTQELYKMAQEQIDEVSVIEDYETAYSILIDSDSPSCITGSLYLVGAIKNLIQNP
ncbi:MAG: bifunctional folylpolyglutamate synthase/dihydrofolate synthase [Thermodesulfobacteriota bacterium]|nr:MAG: bifunctional folylpolyglutamate synthase/dihydrofolate synthase [Thermodesulfobacteriota bacterium]